MSAAELENAALFGELMIWWFECLGTTWWGLIHKPMSWRVVPLDYWRPWRRFFFFVCFFNANIHSFIAPCIGWCVKKTSDGVGSTLVCCFSTDKFLDRVHQASCIFNSRVSCIRKEPSTFHCPFIKPHRSINASAHHMYPNLRWVEWRTTLTYELSNKWWLWHEVARSGEANNGKSLL